MKYRTASKHSGTFKRWTFSLFFSPFPFFSALFKIPGLSPDPRPELGRGAPGSDGHRRWWGLKCNPGPMTTKAWPPEGQGPATFSELQRYPSANPFWSDYTSEDYISGFISALLFHVRPIDWFHSLVLVFEVGKSFF